MALWKDFTIGQEQRRVKACKQTGFASYRAKYCFYTCLQVTDPTLIMDADFLWLAAADEKAGDRG